MASLLSLHVAATVVRAQEEPGALLELRYIPAPRAQVAIWIETGAGRFIRTLSLTEAVGYRGIGNRPGASQMNSGYRWPYGRREGVLPVWAHRRAAAPGARPWKRVIFQDRISEGNASRSSSDHSTDDYYCLSFDKLTTTRDALDAMTCASVFTSDKGRFLTEEESLAGYAEPWEDPASGTGRMQVLPASSPYPPRMDVTRCTSSGCFDHVDVADFAAHARAVMPEIDAVTAPTAPGFVEQSLLFSVPPSWPAGAYHVLVEINVEGDYNDPWNDAAFPTPMTPIGKWDSWAMMYGYPYRGQPSVVYRVGFELSSTGEMTYTTSTPLGRSSWQHWADAYGELEPVATMSDDPQGAGGSGLDRLVRDGAGNRLTLRVETLREPPPANPDTDPFAQDPGTQPPDDEDPPTGEEPPVTGGEPGDAGHGGAAGAAGGGDAGETGGSQDDDPEDPDSGSDQDDPTQGPPPEVIEDDETDAVILVAPDQGLDGPVGEVRGLELGQHRDALHRHEWITIRFRAARASRALHEYEVRVASRPIVDEASFIREGRPAKTATDDSEGAVKLMLPVDATEGQWVRGEIGGLAALTEYHVAVRARDRANRTGPISVARITTPRRTFATVTPCFVASASYGTPLAAEVSVLRRVRDRHLLSHAPGRALVAAYYALGPSLAGVLRERPWLAAWSRAALEPIVALLRGLEGAD
jgi:hypothetical protein